ncbi:2Fe-2S iron-sulfur cluster-binding protein [Gryllotalpicola sp.]|uniref:2Fe-2S iron-sulfur cluster-binding protein n=1 Tax=Gryllotalpicola sp. TaxID=1932787 RepID=UPI0026252918|nr:2Fe-2S iron-sulfur cluster-binding protein [Gryllotalpicola sp.]
MTDPHLWWYVSRSAAIVAWTLLTLTTLWGILLSTRVLRVADNPAWLRTLHAHLSGIALLMTFIHVGSLLLDPYLRSQGFGIAAALVPLSSHYAPLPLSLGIVALYLMAAVGLSSLAMRLLPRRLWKGLHFASYAIVVLVAFHAATAGTDTGTGWYISLSTAVIVATAMAVIVRQFVGSAAAQRRRSAAKTRQSAVRERIPVRVAALRQRAEDVRGVRLVPLTDDPLPPWTPGAHITVHLPNGLERRYSLCGDPAERHSYDIAVARSPDSAGGSRFIHDWLVAGQMLEIDPPRNNFPLDAAPDYLFVAGGIGITPIMAMIASLPASRNWELLYIGRTRSRMAFAESLAARYPGRVTIYARDEHTERLPVADLAAHSTAQVYACGPAGLLDALAAVVPAGRLHLERFVPVDRRAGLRPSPVQVELAGVGSFRVPANRSILDVLEAAGAPIAGSCREGVCGACELRVLDGTPLHLDSVLGDAEKDAARVMYPCVSRSVTDRLVVDLVD